MSHAVYSPADRPEVEVLVDGVWHHGELRTTGGVVQLAVTTGLDRIVEPTGGWVL